MTTAVQVVTLGASHLAGYLTAGIVGIIAYNAFGMQSDSGWDRGTPEFGIKPWQDWAYDLASDHGARQVPAETGWALGAAAVGVLTGIIGVADLLYISTTKILSGVILADGIIALALGVYSVLADDPAMGIIGFFISIESLILTAVGFPLDPPISATSLIFGTMGAGMSYLGCDWD